MKYIFTISKQPDHHGIRILAADVCDYLILSVRVPAYNGGIEYNDPFREYQGSTVTHTRKKILADCLFSLQRLMFEERKFRRSDLQTQVVLVGPH